MALDSAEVPSSASKTRDKKLHESVRISQPTHLCPQSLGGGRGAGRYIILASQVDQLGLHHTTFTEQAEALKPPARRRVAREEEPGHAAVRGHRRGGQGEERGRVGKERIEELPERPSGWR
eukprot:259777-Hanusia_phi.AAC.1